MKVKANEIYYTKGVSSMLELNFYQTVSPLDSFSVAFSDSDFLFRNGSLHLLTLIHFIPQDKSMEITRDLLFMT